MKQKYTPMSNEEQELTIQAIEAAINAQEAISFEIGTAWKNKFDKEPGVYFGFLNGKLCYIGETAELKARMGDLKNTYNHTLRKKLGILKLGFSLEKTASGKLANKFSDQEEEQLNAYMVKHLSIKAFPLNFGRKEVESALIERYEKTILNSVSLRGKSKK